MLADHLYHVYDVQSSTYTDCMLYILDLLNQSSLRMFLYG